MSGGRTVSITLEEDDEEVERTFHPDAITHAWVLEPRFRRLFWLVVTVILLTAGAVGYSEVWWAGVITAIVGFVVLGLIIGEVEAGGFGTVNETFDLDSDGLDEIAEGLAPFRSRFVEYELVNEGILVDRVTSIYLQPSQVCSVRHARGIDRWVLIAAAGVALAIVAIGPEFIEPGLSVLAAVVVLAVASVRVARQARTSQLTIAVTSGEELTYPADREAAQAIVDALRELAGAANEPDRLIEVPTDDRSDRWVHVDNITDITRSTGSFGWRSLVAAVLGAVGGAAAALELVGSEPVAAGVGVVTAAAVAVVLRPDRGLVVRTYAGSHTISGSAVETVTDAFDRHARSYLELEDDELTGGRHLLVTGNIDSVTRPTWRYWPGVVLLALGVALATVGAEPIAAELDAPDARPAVAVAGALVALYGAYWLWRAYRAAAVTVTFDDGTTRAYRLDEPTRRELMAGFREAEVTGQVTDVDASEDEPATTGYNPETAVYLASSHYSLDPVGTLIAAAMVAFIALPIHVGLSAVAAVALVVLSGLQYVLRYRSSRHRYGSTASEQSVDEAAADRLRSALSAGELSISTFESTDGGLCIERHYETTVASDNAVEVDTRPRGVPTDLLLVVFALAVGASPWTLLGYPVDGIVTIGLAIVIAVVTFVLLWVVLDGIIHANYQVVAEVRSGEERQIPLASADATAVESDFGAGGTGGWHW